MMLCFLDSEFSDLDARDSALISFGLVREDGAFFYAELPLLEYQYGASAFVKTEVLPHLWGGGWIQTRQEIQQRLVPWIQDIDDRVMIATDAPEFDFAFITDLLHPWPRNLSKQPLRFDSFVLGINRQAALLDVRTRYFADNNCPEHHSLHDARALRAQFLYALQSGWRPSA